MVWDHRFWLKISEKLKNFSELGNQEAPDSSWQDKVGWYKENQDSLTRRPGFLLIRFYQEFPDLFLIGDTLSIPAL